MSSIISFILFGKQKDKTSLHADEVFLLTIIRYRDDVHKLSEVLETLEFSFLVYGNTFTLSHYIPLRELFCSRTETRNTLHLNNTFICFTIFDLDYSCGIGLKYVRYRMVEAVFEFSKAHHCTHHNCSGIT